MCWRNVPIIQVDIVFHAEFVISGAHMSKPIFIPLTVKRRLTGLFLGLAIVVCWANPLSSQAEGIPNSHRSEPWLQERFVEKQTELHRQPVKLVFLGDSIFHSFEWDPRSPVWNDFYGGRGAVNLGFNGDGAADVSWRLRHGELDGVSPKLAVILIGTNDLGKPAGDVARFIEDLAAAVKERSAATEILVLGILPNGRSGDEQNRIREVNADLEALYGIPGAIASYRDLSCVFLKGGKLNTGLFREPAVPGHSYPLHPTAQGMHLLASYIEPIVATALGDRARTTSGDLEGTDCPH